MAKLFGQATIFVNGRYVDSNKGATLDVGGAARTTKNTSKRVAGYTEETKPSKVELSLPLSADVHVADFDGTDIPITFQTDTGQIYTIPKAWRTDTATMGDQDGDLKLSFEGEPAEEH